MIKLISANDQFLIDEIINKHRQELDVDPLVFDATERQFDLNEVLFEVISLDIFSPKKLIVVRNPLFLSAKQKATPQQEELIKQIIDSDTQDCLLILTLLDLKFDSKKKIVKSLRDHGEMVVIEETKPQTLKQALAYNLKKNGINLKTPVFDHLSHMISNHQSISNAIEKLNLYEGEITIDVIDHLVIDESELVLFDLSNALIEKRFSDAFNIYQQLKKRNIPVDGLIYILASKVRQIYQALVLSENGYNQNEISRLLSISPNYAWVLVNRLNRLLSKKECLQTLKDLALYDQKSKFFVLDKHLEFEIWMVQYGGKYGKS